MSPDENNVKNIQEQNNNIFILFAEDDPVDQEMIFRAIRKTAVLNNVHFVKDGSEALEYINASGQYNWRTRNILPKIVVLDLRMPKINGLDVLKKLRSDDATKHLPAIIFTSSTEDYDCEESYRSGANSFIVKPFNIEEFQQAVIDIVNYWVSRNQTIV